MTVVDIGWARDRQAPPGGSTAMLAERLGEALVGGEEAINGLDGAVPTSRQDLLVGALGVIELQAGPRCRRVLEGLERIGADEDAAAFYSEHAMADPRHGKDWLDSVVSPLADRPGWAKKMVRGARWRLLVNEAFLAGCQPADVVRLV